MTADVDMYTFEKFTIVDFGLLYLSKLLAHVNLFLVAICIESLDSWWISVCGLLNKVVISV